MSTENNDLSCSGNCDFCEDDCKDTDLDQPTVTLTLDDDTEVTCAILTIYPAEENQYIALLPLDDNGENDDGEVYLYQYHENKNGQPTLDNIDTDEEYKCAADAFRQLMATQDLN